MGSRCHLSNHFEVALLAGGGRGHFARRSAAWLATLAIAISPGCSSSDDDDARDASSTSSADQPVAADWIHPGCDAPSLGPPSGDTQSCNGPWAFSYQEFWQNADACGASCSAYQTCTSWDLNSAGDGQGYTVQSWTEISGGWGFTQDASGLSGTSAEDVCGQAATDRRNQLIATRPGMSAQAAATFTVTWASVNEYDLQGGDPRGQDYWHSWGGECQLFITNFPTQMTGAHPWCGCQTMTPRECSRSGGTFTSADVPKSIPDNNTTGVTSAITVPPGLDVKKVLANVNITHTWRGDLEISVIAPNGQVAMLANRVGGSAHDYVATSLDISSSFTAGIQAGGIWKLKVRDLAGADVGTINAFSLEIIGSTPTIGSGTTAPGLHAPSEAGPPSAGSTRRQIVGTPVCQTCDAIPLDSDAHIQAKFDCQNSGLATAVGPLRQSLVARMKLLFQMFGERLTPDQRSRAHALYDQNSSDAPACNTALTWDSACQTEAASHGLPSQLQLCQDLATNAQTSIGIAGLELQHCLDLLAIDAQIQTATCRLQTRDVADSAAQGVLARSYPPLTGDLAALLPGVLARIDAWWVAATTASAGDPQWLLGHANTVLRQLWTSIEQGKLPLPQASGDIDAVTLLNNVNDTGFADDLGVLLALYSPGQSSTVQPPLLTLTADALQPFADRLARLETLHDVGCRFAACRTVDASGHVTLRSSAISELVHALAVLPDHDALAAALAGATRLPQQEAAIFNALTRVRDQHGYLDTVWAALGRSEPFSQLTAVAEPPAEAIALAAIVRTAAVAWSSYQASGKFVPWHRARLTTAALQQPALVAFLEGLRAQVTSARTNYENQRLGLLNDLLNQSHAQAAIQSVTDKRIALRDQDGDLLSRSLGMESREADERAGLSAFQTSFEALINSGVLDANAAYQVQTQTPILVSAANAHFPGIPNPPVLSRDAFRTVTLHTGESLRLHITGNWSPTCAVLNSQIPGPQGNFEPIQVADAQTGPEGYWLSRDNDSFSSHSTSNSADFRKDLGLSAKACYGTAPGASLGASFEACAHADLDWSWTDADTTSGGTSSRFSASFQTGLRVPNTPFPVAPAGSLVAVLTPTGSGPPIAVRVVHRDELILAPALAPGLGDSVDVSFVVNDLGTCNPAADQTLQIEMVKSTPLGNTAKAIGAAMASTLTTLEAQAPAILAQGELTTEEAAVLRQSSWNLVAQNLLPLGIDLAGLPYELRQLFDTFLEREIASIARRSEMHAIARQRVQIQLTDTELTHELAFADTQNRLLMLVPRWRMRDLSGTQLAQAVDGLTTALTAEVAETFELRDPDAFNQFSGTSTQQPNAQPAAALIDLGVTRPAGTTPAGQEHYEDAVVALESFATAASFALGHATFDPAANLRRNLVIAIPRTVTACNGGPCDYQDHWTSVSAATAQAFWSAAGSAPFLSRLTITPSDLYSALGTGRLACGDTAPVVRRIALYLDTGSNTIDLRTTFLDVSGVAAAAGEPVLFPLVGKVLSIDADEPAGIALSLPALNGNVTQVLDRFGSSTTELGTGAGLSPFTTFHIDMTPFQSGIPRTALAAANAVMLVFEVERRVSTSDVQVPGICTPTTP